MALGIIRSNASTIGIICYFLILMPKVDEPLETAELLAFARTVEAQSLSRAATELRVHARRSAAASRGSSPASGYAC